MLGNRSLAAYATSIYLNVLISAGLLTAQSNSDIITKINQAELHREQGLAGYNVTESYKLYRPGEDLPIGEGAFKVAYLRGHGKTYDQQSLSSRKPFAKRAIERTIHGEQRASQPESRTKILLTSDNYYMTVIDQGKEPKPTYLCSIDRPERKTRAVAIKPIRSGPGLIDGLLWVDSENYHVVRVEGQFSDSPSIWVGRPAFERDYIDSNGFEVATSSCSISQSWFSHDKLQITYTGYTFLH